MMDSKKEIIVMSYKEKVSKNWGSENETNYDSKDLEVNKLTNKLEKR